MNDKGQSCALTVPRSCLLRFRIRLVGVDHVVHVGTEDVLGVLVHELLSEDGCPNACTAADAHAHDQLDGREDCQDEAPATDSLPAEPRLEEAAVDDVHERSDGSNAAHALHTRKQTCPCCRTTLTASCPCSASTSRAAASYDPAKNDQSTQDSTDRRVCCVSLLAAKQRHLNRGSRCWQRRLGNLWQAGLAEVTLRLKHQGSEEENLSALGSDAGGHVLLEIAGEDWEFDWTNSACRVEP